MKLSLTLVSQQLLCSGFASLHVFEPYLLKPHVTYWWLVLINMLINCYIIYYQMLSDQLKGECPLLIVEWLGEQVKLHNNLFLYNLALVFFFFPPPSSSFLLSGVFLICWLPFFVTHILNTHCRTCYVPPGLYSAFTWLGYVNSALNPVIYTTFNIEFRRAFIKILSCWWKKKARKLKWKWGCELQLQLSCPVFCELWSQTGLSGRN